MIEIFLQQRRKYHRKYDKVSSRLEFPFTHFFLCPKSWKLYFYGYPEIVEINFFFDKQKGFHEKIVCFLDQI